ncbi:xylulokinase [Deinococcus humi]|uniref:Xylulokinase n=1 Tax=Deinococcus humi TaxID=662880 RepID=A0A7W8JWN3_9DEIO|nr:FGGY family carbohydrate kinase [Deinococcus humi]MBB5364617.1 xylulokinase [Deinococcus humi]GGO39165.1 xylulokinase [Deinococcus humi]
MSAPLMLCLDLGTSVIKAGVLDAGGTVLALATTPTPMHQPAPGVAEQKADGIYAGALRVLREVMEQVPQRSIAALSVSGQMGGVMALDAAGEALSPWFPSTLDRRYQADLEQVWNAEQDWLPQRIGARPISAPRLRWWKREQPEMARRIAKLSTLASYVVGRLSAQTAEAAFIDSTYLTWFGVAHTAQRDWDAELLAAFGVSPDQVPRIVAANDVVGHLSGAAADQIGLRAGVPIFAGVGDSAAGFLGAGLSDPAIALDIAGSYSVFTQYSRGYPADPSLTLQPIASPLGPDDWYALMYINGSGLTHRWFVDEFGGGDYAALDARASLVPPNRGLYFSPHALGRACPDTPALQGGWHGLTLAHRPAHLHRALLEAVAYEFSGAVRQLGTLSARPPLQQVRVMGGGAVSTLWNGIKADVLNVPYLTLTGTEVTLRGLALVAAQGLGLHHDLRAASTTGAQTENVATPNPERHREYAVLETEYHRWLSGYARLCEELRAASTLALSGKEGQE